MSALFANNCYTLGEFHLPTWIFSDFGFFFIYYRILYNCHITVFTTFKMSVWFIFSILLISVIGGAIVIHSWSNLCVKVGFVFVIFLLLFTVGLQFCRFLIQSKYFIPHFCFFVLNHLNENSQVLNFCNIFYGSQLSEK